MAEPHDFPNAHQTGKARASVPPGGAPMNMRDATLRDTAGPNGIYEHAEGAVPPGNRRIVTPPATRGGWATGGMAIPSLFILVALIAVAALIFL